ncbi:MAG: DNA polymerase III subunit beta [Proteobacteria bacterium]|nr:DNA polymerase III subunit beta [Pseudomonadota bacterium]
MKLTIERATLLKSLGHVQSVVERRNTIPILSNVKLEARGGRLAFNATDMDLDINESVATSIATEGATTAPVHILYDIVRKLPDGADVQIEGGTDGQLAVKAGRSRFSLACLPIEDFPLMAGGELPHTFSLSAADLRAIIDHTKFAISTEETRYYLNGIYLHAATRDRSKVLCAVATDGHRLARVQIALPVGAKALPGVIVPRKAVTEIRRLIEDVEGDVGIALSDTKIRVTIGDSVLTSKLIDGTFPDYERVIPTANDKILKVSRALFAEAVDRVSAISTDRSRAVKVEVSKGKLVLSASSPDAGSATEEIEADFDASPIEIGFNARYLLDITQQIGGDTLELAFSDAASPTIVRAPQDTSALYVLMPMRV